LALPVHAVHQTGECCLQQCTGRAVAHMCNMHVTGCVLNNTLLC
jgi:hypothetical protein